MFSFEDCLSRIGVKKMRKIRKLFRSISVLLVAVTVALILPINLYNLYSAGRAQQLLLEYVNASMEGVANLYISELTEQIKEINRYISYIEENDQNLTEMCDARDWASYYIAAFSLRNDMQERLALTDEEFGYFFYVPAMEHGMVVESSAALSQEQWKNAAFADLEKLKSRKWHLMDIDGTKWMIHSNFWRGIYLGAGIQLDSVEFQISESFPGNAMTAVMTTGEDLSYPSDCIHIEKQCMKQDIWLSVQIPKSDIVRNLPVLQRYANWIVILEFLVIPLILYLIHGLVIHPIRKVNRAMDLLKTDPKVRIEGSTFTEEFNSVYRSFNDMADEIVRLKIDNYEYQLDRQKMELRNLQLQVKPHFLFNSLNLMFNLIQMGEYKSVQQMLLYFSDYFRYINVGENDFSLFADEYELIVKYLEVSRIRYPDLFEYTCEIDDRTWQAQVPQLLIHNFVDNVIKHGLDLTRKNHILLKTFIEGNTICYVIQDDGVGMEQEQAERINQGIFEYSDGKRHLGLKNSFRRIRFYYGERGLIHIDATPGKGITVTVKIPFTGEADDKKGV